MCPNCKSKETSKFINKQREIDELLDLNKCFDCDCTYLTFDFEMVGYNKSVATA